MKIEFWWLLALLVLAVDGLLGDPAVWWHPVALFGRVAGRVEKFCRAVLGNTILAGACGWGLLVGGGMLLAGGTVWLAGRLGGEIAAWGAAVFWGYWGVALRSLVEHGRRIEVALRRGDLAGARYHLSMIVSRDTATLHESEIVRGGIESVGENLIDAVTSALFYLLLGLAVGGPVGAAAGVVLLRAGNTLDACWGYRNERYELFGRVAARADDLLHYIPARLTLAAIALAAPVCGGSIGDTWRTGLRHARQHPSPNSGYGMAGFAGALGIRLGGPTVYQGQVENYPCWGHGRAELTAGDLGRSGRLAVVSTLIFVVMIGIVYRLIGEILSR